MTTHSLAAAAAFTVISGLTLANLDAFADDRRARFRHHGDVATESPDATAEFASRNRRGTRRSPAPRDISEAPTGFDNLTNGYLAELAGTAQAKLFVSYATGGADWLPDHLSFTFSRRNPARTALITAHWEPPDKLAELLKPRGCGYHYTHALDAFRATADGGTEVASLAGPLAPLALHRRDHGDPPFMKPGGGQARR